MWCNYSLANDSPDPTFQVAAFESVAMINDLLTLSGPSSKRLATAGSDLLLCAYTSPLPEALLRPAITKKQSTAFETQKIGQFKRCNAKLRPSSRLIRHSGLLEEHPA